MSHAMFVKQFNICVLFICVQFFYFGGCEQTENGFTSMLNQIGTNDKSDPSSLSYCRISTGDLINAAESTASRILQGICNPRQLNERFTSLEAQIVDQFNVLKTMVLNIEDKLRDQDEKVKGQHRKLHRMISNFRNARRNVVSDLLPKASNLVNKKSGVDSGADFSEPDPAAYEYYDETEEELHGGEFTEQVPSPRQPEITKYNSTIHVKDGKRIFTYYWTVRDMPYRMKNWGWRRSLRSESFYIFQYGYRMYLRIYPNQNGKNVYIHVGLTQGDYDAVLDWPFKLKHRIQVLDHTLNGEDLKSRVWDPKELCSGWNWRRPDPGADNYECVGLGFSQDTVKSRIYLHNESITIKLIVFLD